MRIVTKCPARSDLARMAPARLFLPLKPALYLGRYQTKEK